MPQRSALKFAVFTTFALIPMWWKHPYEPPPFTTSYVIGFVIFFPAMLTIVLWAVSGFAGLSGLRNNKAHLMWVLSAVLIAGWALLSSQWAFMRETRPAVAPGAGLQLTAAIAFGLVVSLIPIDRRQLLWVLVSAALIHALIGGVQVLLQHEIGLSALGERVLDPQEGGTSVVQSGNVRWLRPYGLTSHPNIYAGFIVIGLCTAGSLLFSVERRVWLVSLIFSALLWMLFMTFSRAAWLGFIAAGLCFVALNGRQLFTMQRRLLGAIGAAVCLGVLFLLLFRPLIFARAGVGAERTEIRSVGDRVVYTEVALEAIELYPVRGVGAGTFPWYASYYFFYIAENDWRGDNVHNIYLTIQSELASVGSLLFAAAVISALGTGIWRLQINPSPEQSALLCGVIALLVIGLFDHYPWTLFPMQILFWSLLGMAGGKPNAPS